MKLKISFLFLSLSFAVSAQWVQQTSGTQVKFQTITAVDNNIVWTAGYMGRVLSTFDGGASWNLQQPVYPDYNNTGIAAFDLQNAIMISSTYPTGSSPYKSRIWKTSDGGNIWAEKYYSENNICRNIHFFDGSNGVYLGDPAPLNSSRWNILTTTDGGNSWIRIPDSDCPPSDSSCGEHGILHGFGTSGDTVWFSTCYESCPSKLNRLFRSTDRGYHWSVHNMQYSGNNGAVLAFSSQIFGIAVAGSDGIVSKTTDAGMSWMIIDSLNSFNPTAVRTVPGYENLFLAVGNEGRSFFSNDYGYNWIELSSGLQSSLLDVFATQENAWAAGADGTILKLNLTPLITGTRNEELPASEYLLTQNYPNPFNPATRIKYSVPQLSYVTIKVVGLLGNEIETLVNEEKPAGHYELNWTVVDLPSGVYFYRILAMPVGREAGSFIETKKMIFLK